MDVMRERVKGSVSSISMRGHLSIKRVYLYKGISEMVYLKGYICTRVYLYEGISVRGYLSEEISETV